MVVIAVEGEAYGYVARISLFGGPTNTQPCTDTTPPVDPTTCGPQPTVTLPSGGSALLSASVPTGRAQFGPATPFLSGPITVTTEGTTGPTGSTTTTANIQAIDTIFVADNMASTCTADESGTTGATTITNGRLQTSEGNPNVQGDETVVTLPTSPEPNTTYNGAIETVGDSFRAVYNEQIVNPDGSPSTPTTSTSSDRSPSATSSWARSPAT